MGSSLLGSGLRSVSLRAPTLRDKRRSDRRLWPTASSTMTSMMAPSSASCANAPSNRVRASCWRDSGVSATWIQTSRLCSVAMSRTDWRRVSSRSVSP